MVYPHHSKQYLTELVLFFYKFPMPVEMVDTEDNIKDVEECLLLDGNTHLVKPFPLPTFSSLRSLLSLSELVVSYSIMTHGKIMLLVTWM